VRRLGRRRKGGRVDSRAPPLLAKILGSRAQSPLFDVRIAIYDQGSPNGSFPTSDLGAEMKTCAFQRSMAEG